jgi:hypothetical protein
METEEVTSLPEIMPVVLPAYNYEKEQEPTVPEPSKEAGLQFISRRIV